MLTRSPYVGDGTTRAFNLTFSYDDPSSVRVAVGGVDVSFTWLSPSQVELAVAPAAGVSVVLYRETDIADPSVVFSNTEVLTAEVLNQSVKQVLNSQQEVIDTIDATIAEAEAAAAVAADAAVQEALPGVSASASADAAAAASAVLSAKADKANVPTVKDSGAAADGAANDTAAVQAAATAGNLRFPKGNYRINSNVTIGGAVSWRLPPGASFSGAGVVLSPDMPGWNYTLDARKVQLLEALGSIASPTTSNHPVAAFHKNSLTGDTGGAPNAAAVYQHNHYGSVGEAKAQGAYYECVVRVGGVGVFGEGGRFHAIVPAGITGKAYGAVFYAENSGDGKNAVGTEAEVARIGGAGAVAPTAWTSAQQLDAMFLATVRSGQRPMAAFLVNPFNVVKTRVGFLVGNSFAAQGVNRNIVDFAAFATLEADVPHGLYARNITYSLVSGPNSVPIRMAKADNSAELDVLRLAADNVLHVGTEAVGTKVAGPIYVDVGALSDCANDTAAAAAGIPVGRLYRNGSALMVRVA